MTDLKTFDNWLPDLLLFPRTFLIHYDQSTVKFMTAPPHEVQTLGKLGQVCMVMSSICIYIPWPFPPVGG